MHSQADTTAHNADFDEIGKFTKLADEWWIVWGRSSPCMTSIRYA